MRITRTLLAAKAYKQYKLKVFKNKSNNGREVSQDVAFTNTTNGTLAVDEPSIEIEKSDYGPNYRENEMKIQMLSKPLYEQIFKNSRKEPADKATVER